MSENVNTVMNGSQPSTCFNNPTVEKIGKTFFYCSIFLVSLAGNTVIGIIVYKTKTMRKPINFLIVSMAISDLLYPIFLIPMLMQGLYIKDAWLIGGPLGQALCKLVFFLTHASGLVSVLSMVLIAVDRFGAVVFPIRSPPISSKLCPFFILTTWIIAMAVGSPYLFVMKLVEYPGRLECKMLWNEVFGETFSFNNYFVAFSVVFIFIPLVLIAILYIFIFFKLKSRKIPGEQSANTEAEQRRQRERNVLKMAIAIVLGFAVCWLPFIIMYLLVFFASDIVMSCGFQYFNSSAFLMLSANCAINPCICFIFSSNYREGLKTLLR